MARAGEHLAQDLGDPLRFLVDLVFAQPLHLEAKPAQLEIAPAVVEERLFAAVIPITVGFDYESKIRPDEVRLELANQNINLRRRQAVSPADPQKVALEVAAGAIVMNVLAEWQTEHICLPNRPSELLLRNVST
jgi:hypothetical protein